MLARFLGSPPANIPLTWDLLPLSIALQNQAAYRLWWSVGLAALAAGVSLVTTLVSVDKDPLWGPLTALLACIIGIASYASYRLYELRYALGAETKRFVLLEDGLAWVIPNSVRTSLLNRAGRRARWLAEKQLTAAATYYASTTPPGARRLLEHLQQSAFFTWNLYRSLRNVLLIVLIVLSLVTVGVGWTYLVSPAPQEVRITLGRFVLAFIPAILSVGVVAWVFRLDDLSDTICAIDAELEALSDSAAERDVLRLMAEYNCQLVQGLPVPGWLYRQRRDELNELWSVRCQRRPAP